MQLRLTLLGPSAHFIRNDMFPGKVGRALLVKIREIRGSIPVKHGRAQVFRSSGVTIWQVCAISLTMWTHPLRFM